MTRTEQENLIHCLQDELARLREEVRRLREERASLRQELGAARFLGGSEERAHRAELGW